MIITPKFFFALSAVGLCTTWYNNILFLFAGTPHRILQSPQLTFDIVMDFFFEMLHGGNLMQTAIAVEVQIIVITLATFFAVEGTRRGIRFANWYILLTYVVALAVAFPLFIGHWILKKDAKPAVMGRSEGYCNITPLFCFTVLSLCGMGCVMTTSREGFFVVSGVYCLLVAVGLSCVLRCPVGPHGDAISRPSSAQIADMYTAVAMFSAIVVLSLRVRSVSQWASTDLSMPLPCASITWDYAIAVATAVAMIQLDPHHTRHAAAYTAAVIFLPSVGLAAYFTQREVDHAPDPVGYEMKKINRDSYSVLAPGANNAFSLVEIMYAVAPLVVFVAIAEVIVSDVCVRNADVERTVASFACRKWSVYEWY